MSNWKPGNLPRGVEEYGIHQAIWTDADMFKWMLIAFAAGILIGQIL
jgi:hypothetical protein